MKNESTALVFEFSPHSAPLIEPDEVSAAIRTGGARGVAMALADLVPGISLEDRTKISRHVLHVPMMTQAAQMLDQYRRGEGAQDRAEVLDYLGRLALAASILHDTLIEVGGWIAANPGSIVHDPTAPDRQRRIFPGSP